MTKIMDLLFTAKENPEAVEGFCTNDTKPKPAEICSHRIGSEDILFQCVFINAVNENISYCRFEKIERRLVF